MDCKKGILRLFYRGMMFCYKKLHLWKIPVPGRDRVKTDLNRLHPGENPQECMTDYYVTKLTICGTILLAGILAAVLLHYGRGEPNIVEKQWIYRESGTEKVQKYDIIGQTEDGGKYSFQVEVAPRKYREEELQELYRQFAEVLPQRILGENTSLDSVRSNLKLLESYEGFPFFVEWKSENGDVIGEDGKVSPQQTVVPVVLTAKISYEQFSRETAITVRVIEKEETAAEKEKNQIAELLQQAQEADPEKERFQLPDKINGKDISWEEKDPKTGWKLLAGAIATAAVVFFFQDRDLHDLVEKKKREERRTYPEILQKLTLYLQAGLTVRAAFCRVADDYEKEQKNGGHPLAAYEEMLITVREIRMGIPEGTAYENFGKRTGVREYVRLSTFLMQNLKKGSTALLQQLREEARQAEEMRIQNARKLSEEATTKLLLPMVMLLVIVMVMIMIPAFSNAGV